MSMINGDDDGDGSEDDDDAIRSASTALAHRHLKQTRSNALT